PDGCEPPYVPSRRDEGFVEPALYVSTTPSWVAFLNRYGTGGVRATTFFATTPVFREALDHRLFARSPSGMSLNRLHASAARLGHSLPGNCTKRLSDYANERLTASIVTSSPAGTSPR